jgi:hypothetical protein
LSNSINGRNKKKRPEIIQSIPFRERMYKECFIEVAAVLIDSRFADLSVETLYIQL